MSGFGVYGQGACCGLAALCCLGGATAANAGQVTFTEGNYRFAGSIEFRAGPSQVNKVALVTSGTGLDATISDGLFPMKAGNTAASQHCVLSPGLALCHYVAPDTQNLLLSPGIGFVRIELGDGHDSSKAHGKVAAFHDGGSGNDVMRGSDDAGDAFVGGAGADYMSGGRGPAQSGPVVAGGDTAIYEASPGPVSVTGDGIANDGQAGEGDNVVADIEQVIGSRYDDFLFAVPTGSSLEGLDGADTLTGGPGNDALSGGRWWDDDTGDDTATGGSGHDVISGGDGADTLIGGAGPDLIYGDNGSDVLRSRDGEADDVYCDAPFGVTPAVDVVIADALDTLYGTCEQVEIG